jgi:dihydrofolate reductase
MKVIIIAAIAENNAIGKDNDLLWHLPDDMKFFRDQTLHHPVIMGRKNYDSIPERYRPLNDRLNIIITRNKDFKAQKCLVFHSLKEATSYCEHAGYAKSFIIGGGEIYSLALRENIVDEMLLTEVKTTLDAHAFFPEFNRSDWKPEHLLSHPADNRHLYPFEIVRYSKK